MKKLLKDAKDPHLSLLAYRSTPLPWCKLSPAELLMGRNIRSNIPQVQETLIPQWPYLTEFRHTNDLLKSQQKVDYDKRHRTQPLPDIPDDTEVWINTNGNRSTGHVTGPADAPRSYMVETRSGQVRRNRSHLLPMPNTHTSDSDNSPLTTDRSPIMTRTRTGTMITPPDRL